MTATIPSRAGARGGLWGLALLLALALHAAGGAWLTRWHPAPTAATVPAPVMAQLVIKPSKPVAPPFSAPAMKMEKPRARPALAIQPKSVPAPRSEAVPPAVTPPSPAIAPASVSAAAPSSAPAVPPPVPDLAAQCRYRQAPVYPAAARRRGLEGSVRLRVALDATGAIDAISLIESSGSQQLDTAALAAVRRWRCAPARVDGRAVPSVAVQRINFQLK